MIRRNTSIAARAALFMFFSYTGTLATAQEAQNPLDDVSPFDEVLPSSEFPEKEVDPNVSGLLPIFAPVDGILPNPDGTFGSAEPDDPDNPVDEPEYIQQPAVLLRGLDKISGRSTDINLAVDESAMFGGLRISVKACHQTPPTEPPESIAYIEVEDYGFSSDDLKSLPEKIDKKKRVFHGWMFASSPGINGLEHPIYDVWVIRCMAEVPVLSDSESES